MRDITVGGTPYQVRPLKRKEVKALKKKGINLGDLNPANADDAMDAVFDMVFVKDEMVAIDELDNPEALKLWQAIIKETFGAPNEEKN